MITYTPLELEAVGIVEQFYQKIWTPDFTQDVINKLKEGLRQYQQTSGLRSYVLGMSGGLDSAICAALAAGLNVHGMFVGINSSEEHRRLARLTAAQFCRDYSEKFISSEELLMFRNTLLSSENDRVAAGNLKARLRMIAIYDLAKKHQGCVLSTDNLSEYHMGFWTLHGDVGDIAPIQFLNKGFELQYVAKSLGISQEVIDQAPSDGLNVTAADTDEAQLGGNYRLVDTVMWAYFNKEFGQLNQSLGKIEKTEVEVLQRLLVESTKAQNIVARFLNTQFKRRGAPLFKLNTPASKKFLEYDSGTL